MEHKAIYRLLLKADIILLSSSSSATISSSESMYSLQLETFSIDILLYDLFDSGAKRVKSNRTGYYFSVSDPAGISDTLPGYPFFFGTGRFFFLICIHVRRLHIRKAIGSVVFDARVLKPLAVVLSVKEFGPFLFSLPHQAHYLVNLKSTQFASHSSQLLRCPNADFLPRSLSDLR